VRKSTFNHVENQFHSVPTTFHQQNHFLHRLKVINSGLKALLKEVESCFHVQSAVESEVNIVECAFESS